jgi:hypothetical protein
MGQVVKEHNLTAELVSISEDNVARILFKTSDKKAEIPVRGYGKIDNPDAVYLFSQALSSLAIYDGCDDFMDWADEYGLSAADITAQNEFRDITLNRRDFILMISDEAYANLQLEIQMAQAIGAAFSSWQQHHSNN